MYRNLMAEMARKGITYIELSNITNIPVNTLRDKIQGRTPLHLKQAQEIFLKVFPDLDFFYLFKEDNDV